MTIMAAGSFFCFPLRPGSMQRKEAVGQWRSYSWHWVGDTVLPCSTFAVLTSRR
jgi:hypothetical protein